LYSPSPWACILPLHELVFFLPMSLYYPWGQKKICVFTVTWPTLFSVADPNLFISNYSTLIFTQNSDNHFCCLISSNVLFIQPLAFCRNWEQRR
jgi:hypothetical protein